MMIRYGKDDEQKSHGCSDGEDDADERIDVYKGDTNEMGDGDFQVASVIVQKSLGQAACTHC